MKADFGKPKSQVYLLAKATSKHCGAQAFPPGTPLVRAKTVGAQHLQCFCGMLQIQILRSRFDIKTRTDRAKVFAFLVGVGASTTRFKGNSHLVEKKGKGSPLLAGAIA